MDEKYDAIVIGAGIGGLATAAVLAKDGMKVAVLERADRVGGRALSLEGSEISDKGADWYRAVLGRHYCYLAEASPSIEKIVEERMLDGYVIDLGYHGVPCAGQGYLGRLVDYLGVDVKINPCDTGLYYKGEFYVEPAPGSARLDDKLYKICKEKGINYWSFNTEALGLTAEQLDELEKVSLWDYCERLGLTADDVVWEAYHCLGTLFTTINNPHDISAGEIIRYTNDIMMPVITSGGELHVGVSRRAAYSTGRRRSRASSTCELRAERSGASTRSCPAASMPAWKRTEWSAPFRSRRPSTWWTQRNSPTISCREHARSTATAASRPTSGCRGFQCHKSRRSGLSRPRR